MAVTVRLKSLGGTWETVGSGRLRGIVPEGYQGSGNEMGPDTCSFTLRRKQVGASLPDVSAFTPCEIEKGGSVVWDGFVWETPGRGGSDAALAVSGRGWQYHLDDDDFPRTYVHNRLSDYRDSRSFPGCVLGEATGFYPQGGQVVIDNGQVLIGFQRGTAIPNTAERVGATLDLGPDPRSWAMRLVCAFNSSNGDANANFSLMASDFDHTTGLSSGQFDGSAGVNNNAGATGTQTLTCTTPRRFIHMFMQENTTGTFALDVWFQITKMLVFGSTTWESGSASAVTADDVVIDALGQAAPLISSDRSRINVGTFKIPSLSSGEVKTPREWIEAGVALEGSQYGVDIGAVPFMRPFPSAPIFSIPAAEGDTHFDDTSLNSGASIYSKARVEGTDSKGDPLVVEGRPSSLPNGFSIIQPITTPAPVNPSFDVNTTGWSVDTGTLSRTTTGGEFDSTPGGGKWITAVSPGTLTGQFTGTFVAGETYVLTWRARVASGTSGQAIGFGRINSATAWRDDFTSILSGPTITTSFQTFTASWTPKVDQTSLVVLSIGPDTSSTIFIDSLQLSRVIVTLPDKRGFTRSTTIQVQAAIDAAAAQQLIDIFLGLHSITPLKGTLSVAPGGLKRIAGGGGVHPAELMRRGGELVRFGYMVDPSDGSFGRDGRIVSVQYDDQDEVALVQIDNERNSFDALLARLAIVAPTG